MIGEMRFGAIRGPAYRTARDFRSDQHTALLGIESRLHAETAADIGGDDAHLLRWHVEDARDIGAQTSRALIARIERVVILRRVVVTYGIARFHRIHDDAVLNHVEADDVRGTCERGVGFLFLAVAIVETEIARDLIPYLRTFRRAFQIRNSIERFVIDHHEFGGIARFCQRLGNHENDRLADEGHLIFREEVLRHALHRRTVAAFHRCVRGHRFGASSFKIGLRQNGEDTGRLFCGARINRENSRVRMRRTQENALCFARQAQIIRILTVTCDKANVLRPPDGLAGAEFHCASLVAIAWIDPVQFAQQCRPGERTQHAFECHFALTGRLLFHALIDLVPFHATGQRLDLHRAGAFEIIHTHERIRARPA